MTREQKILSTEFIVISLLWGFLIASPLIFMNSYNPNWRAIHIMWVESAIAVIIFLINRFLLMPRLFFKQEYSKYILSFAIIFSALAIFIFYFDGMQKIVVWLWGESGGPTPQDMPHGSEAIGTHPPGGGVGGDLPPRGSMHPGGGGGGMQPRRVAPEGVPQRPSTFSTNVIHPSITVFILTSVVTLLDLGLNIAIKWAFAEQKQAELNRERVSAQLSNLQNQVSPHFFMNTLNNIHALVDINSQRAKDTIIELSGLMGYLLYESSSQESVTLKRELEFIKSYINLMRLRYPKRVIINFSYDSDIPSVKIPPLLFLNFIENAFKYGVDYSQDSYIKIHFSFSDSFVEMSSINSNHSASTNSSRHGFGITNSKKRLKLLYNDRYSLNIEESKDIYIVNLKIPTTI